MRLPPVAIRSPEQLALGEPLLPPRVSAAAPRLEAGGGGLGRVPEALHRVPAAGADQALAEEEAPVGQRRRR